MMGKFGADIAQVTVESAWWSHINWTQVVAWVCSALVFMTSGKFDVSAEAQVQIVLAIQGISGLLTIWLRNRSSTITPNAAAKLSK